MVTGAVRWRPVFQILSDCVADPKLQYLDTDPGSRHQVIRSPVVVVHVQRSGCCPCDASSEPNVLVLVVHLSEHGRMKDDLYQRASRLQRVPNQFPFAINLRR